MSAEALERRVAFELLCASVIDASGSLARELKPRAVPEDVIAARIQGSTRQTLNNALKNLEDQKLVKTNAGLVSLNIKESLFSEFYKFVIQEGASITTIYSTDGFCNEPFLREKFFHFLHEISSRFTRKYDEKTLSNPSSDTYVAFSKATSRVFDKAARLGLLLRDRHGKRYRINTELLGSAIPARVVEDAINSSLVELGVFTAKATSLCVHNVVMRQKLGFDWLELFTELFPVFNVFFQHYNISTATEAMDLLKRLSGNERDSIESTLAGLVNPGHYIRAGERIMGEGGWSFNLKTKSIDFYHDFRAGGQLTIRAWQGKHDEPSLYIYVNQKHKNGAKEAVPIQQFLTIVGWVEEEVIARVGAFRELAIDLFQLFYAEYNIDMMVSAATRRRLTLNEYNKNLRMGGFKILVQAYELASNISGVPPQIIKKLTEGGAQALLDAGGAVVRFEARSTESAKWEIVKQLLGGKFPATNEGAVHKTIISTMSNINTLAWDEAERARNWQRMEDGFDFIRMDVLKARVGIQNLLKVFSWLRKEQKSIQESFPSDIKEQIGKISDMKEDVSKLVEGQQKAKQQLDEQDKMASSLLAEQVILSNKVENLGKFIEDEVFNRQDSFERTLMGLEGELVTFEGEASTFLAKIDQKIDANTSVLAVLEENDSSITKTQESLVERLEMISGNVGDGFNKLFNSLQTNMAIAELNRARESIAGMSPLATSRAARRLARIDIDALLKDRGPGMMAQLNKMLASILDEARLFEHVLGREDRLNLPMGVMLEIVEETGIRDVKHVEMAISAATKRRGFLKRSTFDSERFKDFLIRMKKDASMR